jgi:NAD(P)-dependent dehydrogenase (short-subunit alcohol dehydrogenase family)
MLDQLTDNSNWMNQIMTSIKKNILITGASGNLGQAVVKKFLSQGDRVIAVLSPGTTKEFNGKGDVVVKEADLTNERSVEALIAGLVADHYAIDAALFLAGGYASGGIAETDGALLRKMYSLNFETAYFAVRPIFAQMMKQPSGGRIVLVGARPALLPNDGKASLAYALSKSLIFKLADYLNADGASNNVLSTVIVPSTLDTPANRQSMPGTDFSLWVKPEEVADVIAFAASDNAAPLRDTVLKIYGKA